MCKGGATSLAVFFGIRARQFKLSLVDRLPARGCVSLSCTPLRCTWDLPLPGTSWGCESPVFKKHVKKHFMETEIKRTESKKGPPGFPFP